jgi:predicted amidophosphoribosyltransferase
VTINPGRDGPAVVAHVLLGSFAADREDPLHRLVRAARAGDPAATSSILAAVDAAAASQALPMLADPAVVPVPGHAPDSVPPLVEAVARRASRVMGWRYVEGALVRRRGTAEAKLGGPRGLVTEAETLEWLATPHSEVIVLVDDVVRSGMTLAACVHAIRARGDPRDVLALVIAAACVS